MIKQIMKTHANRILLCCSITFVTNCWWTFVKGVWHTNVHYHIYAYQWCCCFIYSCSHHKCTLISVAGHVCACNSICCKVLLQSNKPVTGLSYSQRSHYLKINSPFFNFHFSFSMFDFQFSSPSKLWIDCATKTEDGLMQSVFELRKEIV